MSPVSPVIAAALPPGGTIGIVSPASPYDRPSDLLRGVAWWEARGYRVKLAEGIHERTDWTAGGPQTRAHDLMALFADPEVDAIQCLRGGIGSTQVIPLLDFDRIAAHPKPFIGASDITALHTALLRRAGLATFYGPMLTGIATWPWPGFTTERLLQVLGGQTTGPIPRDPEDPFVRALAPGTASGRVVGGHLGALLATMGTPWEVDLDDALFVFEEVDRGPSFLERGLVQLEQAGKLAGVRGVVVGDLANCEWDEDGPYPHSKTLEQVLEERLAPLGVPVLYPLPFGHGDRFATIPLGVQGTLDAQTGTLVITEPALRPARAT